MRRALAWTAGIVGIAALARLLRRRAATLPVEPAPATDPANELRRVLDESRPPETEPRPVAEPEPSEEASLEPEPSEEPSLEERRADVHARAESAIARMRQGDG
jgi:hypothetical protein